MLDASGFVLEVDLAFDAVPCRRFICVPFLESCCLVVSQFAIIVESVTCFSLTFGDILVVEDTRIRNVHVDSC